MNASHKRVWWLTLAAGCFITAAVALAGLRIATTRGIGVTPDSMVYADTASKLLDGQGFYYRTVEGGMAPLHLFPPAYPATLAGVAKLTGLSPFDAAAWLNALLLTASATAFGVLLAMQTGSRSCGLLGAWLMSCSKPMIDVHSMAWSEPLFLFATISGLSLLASFLAGGRRRTLILAGLCISVAMLVRYAGAPVLLTALFATLVIRQREIRIAERLRDVAILAAMTFPPILLWTIRNTTITGNPTGRTITPHPMEVDPIAGLRWIFEAWVVPARLPMWVTAGLVLVLAAGLSSIVLRRRVENQATVERRALLIATVYAFFVAGFVAFMAVSISFIDGMTPYDSRIMVPIWPFSVALVILLARVAWIRSPQGSLRRVSLVASALLVSMTVGSVAVGTVLEARDQGRGYRSLQWTDSALKTMVGRIPPDVRLFSNEPHAIVFLTGRDCHMLPRTLDPTTRLARKEYGGEFAALQRDLAEGRAVVLWVRDLKRAWLPDESAIAGLVPLMASDEPLRLYGLAPVTPSPGETQPDSGQNHSTPRRRP